MFWPFSPSERKALGNAGKPADSGHMPICIGQAGERYNIVVAMQLKPSRLAASRMEASAECRSMHFQNSGIWNTVFGWKTSSAAHAANG